jgi:hypothetical protein
MFVKIRYSFYQFDDSFPRLIFLTAGLDPINYYCSKYNLSEEEYDQQVRHMEALPGLFLEGEDACTLARSILSQLDLPEDEAEEVFTKNSMFAVKEFYSILNNLIDKLWQIRMKLSTQNL